MKIADAAASEITATEKDGTQTSVIETKENSTTQEEVKEEEESKKPMTDDEKLKLL